MFLELYWDFEVSLESFISKIPCPGCPYFSHWLTRLVIKPECQRF